MLVDQLGFDPSMIGRWLTYFSRLFFCRIWRRTKSALSDVRERFNVIWPHNPHFYSISAKPRRACPADVARPIDTDVAKWHWPWAVVAPDPCPHTSQKVGTGTVAAQKNDSLTTKHDWSKWQEWWLKQRTLEFTCQNGGFQRTLRQDCGNSGSNQRKLGIWSVPEIYPLFFVYVAMENGHVQWSIMGKPSRNVRFLHGYVRQAGVYNH